MKVWQTGDSVEECFSSTRFQRSCTSISV